MLKTNLKIDILKLYGACKTSCKSPYLFKTTDRNLNVKRRKLKKKEKSLPVYDFLDIITDEKLPEGLDTKNAIAFVDGSYDPKNKKASGAVIFCLNGKAVGLADIVKTDAVDIRNVSGEILASMLACKKALQLQLPKITIVHDYIGIGNWVKGTWKANNPYTKEYRDFMQGLAPFLEVEFVHVKGHSKILGNELADDLAKKTLNL